MQTDRRTSIRQQLVAVHRITVLKSKTTQDHQELVWRLLHAYQWLFMGRNHHWKGRKHLFSPLQTEQGSLGMPYCMTPRRTTLPLILVPQGWCVLPVQLLNLSSLWPIGGVFSFCPCGDTWYIAISNMPGHFVLSSHWPQNCFLLSDLTVQDL